jgi:hypothetical protein
MSQEQIEEIKKRIMHPDAEEFNIRRAPKRELEVFKKFANEEFLGDYGMAFREIVQTMLMRPSEFQPVFQLLEQHEQRLLALEGNTGQPEGEVFLERKTLSGRVIRYKQKEVRKVFVEGAGKVVEGGEENGRDIKTA